ncbi:hypothetical protein CLU79DRAFT_874472 [Phycomyces nitens]|nr:hypothetical protein CLU79DRAFT_874472 [Phycomyces nitens]
MYSLWRTVHIPYDESAVMSQNISASNLRKNGPLFREIITNEHFQPDSIGPVNIQAIFPNVQRISLFIKDQNTAVDWISWRNLIYVKIVFTGYYKDIKTTIFSETFSQLPCLREVSLRFEEQEILSIGDLEAIHNLQHLRTLKLVLKQVDLNFQDLAIIAKIVPANHLSKVELRLDISDLRWIYYFAIKYQNVRELDLYTMNKVHDVEDYHLEDAKSRIAILPQVFSKLEKLEIEPFQAMDTFTLAFWKCFSDDSFSIKEIIYSLPYLIYGANIIQDLTREIIRVCSKTIESITFILRSPSNIPKNEYITRAFSYCPRLVYLHFYRCGATIEPDTMLEYLPSLKELSLYTEKIYMSSRATKVASSHGLRVINLNAVSTDPDSLKYITTRCESLSHMRLEGVNIFGDISPSTGCCLIDMSNARLTELKIDSLFFKSSCQEWKWNEFTELHFMKIARLTALHVRNINGIENTEIYGNISNDAISIWHHVLGHYSYPKDLDTLITKQTKVNTIEEYFQDFQVNRVRDRSQRTAISETNQKPRNWTMNLWRGYALFVCGYAENYDIKYGHNEEDEEYYKWDKDKNIVNTVSKP